ncbi:hypothetical protein JL720_1968 [Aureococcus anophagefferens]|nr:hypothetical protein JL720_1968 [Aureococcus anophagefferens]
MAARPRRVVFWLLLCPVRAFLGPPPPLRASPRPLRASPRPLRASPRPLRAAAADGAAGVAVRIEYCTGCRWMLRSAWLAQELLTTFDAGEIGEVALAPHYGEPGGVFVVTVDGAVVWDRAADGGFPETKALKQRIRDVVDPAKGLGHSGLYPAPAEGDVKEAAPEPPTEGSSWDDDWTRETDLKSGLFGGDDDVAAKLAELERLTSLGRAGAVKLIERTNAFQRPAPEDLDDVDFV